MMNCDQEEDPDDVLVRDIENLLTPGIVGQWEFALSGTDEAVEYVRMKVCNGCGGDHVRLFFESLEERGEEDVPDRAWVVEMAKDGDGDLMVRVHIYDGGLQIAGCFVRPTTAGIFLRDYADTVAQSVLPLRSAATRSVPAGTMVH